MSRSVHEPHEERMGFGGAALEFGMALTCHEPRVIGDLDHLDQALVWRDARYRKPCFRERVAISVVHFVAMAVTLIDELFTICFMCA